jgi:hypothetical protein
MVSKEWMLRPASCGPFHWPWTKSDQPKLYGDRNEAIFSLLPLELRSTQSLGLYSIPLALRQPNRTNDGRDREMFFLLRLVFWLGLVLVLLPREKTPQSEKLPQISVSDAVNAASAAVSDVSQFCKRQPQACEVGGQAATVLGVRAEEGARKIYRSITDKKSDADKKSPDHTGSIGSPEVSFRNLAETASNDTLTPEDLVVPWRAGP